MASVKKIALGLATVLAFSTLAITPANAVVGTALTVDGNSVTSSAIAPVELNVPETNVVDVTNTLRIAVTGLDADTTVTATATNAALLTSLVGKNASSGTNHASVNTGTGSTADIYVYTQNLRTGSVAVTVGGNTTTYYVKGIAGSLSRISLSASDSAGSGTIQRVTVGGTDVFGNIVVGATIKLLAITGTVSDSYTLVTGSAGTDYVDLVLPASGNVTLVATATVADAVPGLTAPVGALTKVIGVRDLVAELTAKDAIIAGLKADLAKAQADTTAANVTILGLKNQYNGLAKRYNTKVRRAHRVPFLPVN